MAESGSLIGAGWDALDRHDDAEARRIGTALLEEAPTAVQRWDHGNMIHFGHLLLGHVALRRGDVQAAEAHLLAGGRTPGSPQLDSFGPNMSLAAALVEAGSSPQVLRYLDDCAMFWQLGRRRLRRWRRTIEAGQAPDFGANMVYGRTMPISQAASNHGAPGFITAIASRTIGRLVLRLLRRRRASTRCGGTLRKPGSDG